MVDVLVPHELATEMPLHYEAVFHDPDLPGPNLNVSSWRWATLTDKARRPNAAIPDLFRERDLLQGAVSFLTGIAAPT
jgi:hypothetical protein